MSFRLIATAALLGFHATVLGAVDKRPEEYNYFYLVSDSLVSQLLNSGSFSRLEPREGVQNLFLRALAKESEAYGVLNIFLKKEVVAAMEPDQTIISQARATVEQQLETLNTQELLNPNSDINSVKVMLQEEVSNALEVGVDGYLLGSPSEREAEPLFPNKAPSKKSFFQKIKSFFSLSARL